MYACATKWGMKWVGRGGWAERVEKKNGWGRKEDGSLRDRRTRGGKEGRVLRCNDNEDEISRGERGEGGGVGPHRQVRERAELRRASSPTQRRVPSIRAQNTETNKNKITETQPAKATVHKGRWRGGGGGGNRTKQKNRARGVRGQKSNAWGVLHARSPPSSLFLFRPRLRAGVCACVKGGRARVRARAYACVSARYGNLTPIIASLLLLSRARSLYPGTPRC